MRNVMNSIFFTMSLTISLTAILHESVFDLMLRVDEVYKNYGVQAGEDVISILARMTTICVLLFGFVVAYYFLYRYAVSDVDVDKLSVKSDNGQSSDDNGVATNPETAPESV